MKKLIISLLLMALSFTIFADTKPEQDSLRKQQNQLNTLGLSDKAIEKLSADQIVKIYSSQQRHRFLLGSSSNETKQVAVPVVMFISIAAVISLALFLRYKKSQSLHNIIYKSLETGTNIPLELLAKTESGKRISDFKKGIILTAGGLGLILVLYIENKMWSVGLIPLFVGIGFLIVDKLDKKTKGTVSDNG